jgi:hypothetical protein
VQRADPANRAEVYSELGLRMVYQPSRRVIKPERALWAHVQKIVSEGGLAPYTHGL